MTQLVMKVVQVVQVVQFVKSSTFVSGRIALGGNGKESGLVGRVQVLSNGISGLILWPEIYDTSVCASLAPLLV